MADIVNSIAILTEREKIAALYRRNRIGYLTMADLPKNGQAWIEQTFPNLAVLNDIVGVFRTGLTAPDLPWTPEEFWQTLLRWPAGDCLLGCPPELTMRPKGHLPTVYW